MSNKNNKNNIKDERIEDTTQYGEFVSSFHEWITPEEQKKKARHLAQVTEKNNKTRKNSIEKEES
ncbi:hypothetical protein RBH29_00380 [Herbivorax sp. ANBcel31]|uniref:hypothetical protein n=1 Tax=Herbivorax sp. ANBcel31 TaxID=3069754 RepID=UPI0027B667CD|nr:hypothetical protein [Herbivorax sp. ANBcel31]MDQ2084892.1 hypothetical protein [Herbivorax sp. ANBcel31]